jgi:hypothetical protein
MQVVCSKKSLADEMVQEIEFYCILLKGFKPQIYG